MPDGKGGRRTETLWGQDRFAENGVRDAGAAAQPLRTEKEGGGQVRFALGDIGGKRQIVDMTKEERVTGRKQTSGLKRQNIKKKSL